MSSQYDFFYSERISLFLAFDKAIMNLVTF